jgi:hypothetical protein
MIQHASVLRASEERLNLALHHQEMLTREMSHRVKNLFAIACVREALMLIEHHLVQAAVLDVNLSDRDVTPIAELLIEGGIPVIYTPAWLYRSHFESAIPPLRCTRNPLRLCSS